MVRDAVRGRTGEELLHDLEEFIPGGVLYRGKLPDEVSTVFARGSGSRIWDVDGNEYIDYVLGSGPMIRGHAHPAVTRALRDRVERGTQFMQPTDVMLKHARKVMSAISVRQEVTEHDNRDPDLDRGDDRAGGDPGPARKGRVR